MNMKKGQGRGLTRDIIISCALTIVEKHGLQAFSARKLASALGCEAMSLYYHFPNMDALLDAIVDTLLVGQHIGQNQGQSSAKDLMQAAIAYLSIAEQNPHAFQLVATRRWQTPNALAAVYSMVSAFASLGFSADQAIGKSRILAAYLNGAGTALAAWRKSDGKVSDEVRAALPCVPPDSLQADTVRTDLLFGLDMIISALTKKEGAPASS
jgi:AcrR family transcriptional regulator